jgi:hypothetical protein
LRDQYNNPVQGKNVIIYSTGTNNTIVQPTATTNADGEAFASIKSTTAEVKTITAEVTTDSQLLTDELDIIFTGPPSPVNSYLTVDKTSAYADGVDEITITAHLYDANNNKTSNWTVNFSVDDSRPTITQPASKSDVNGLASGTIVSEQYGTFTISAEIVEESLTLNDTVEVTFNVVEDPEQSGNLILEITPGSFGIQVSSCDMGSIDIAASDQTMSCTTEVTFVDLRGSGAGWSAVASMTNFEGENDGSVLALCRAQYSGGVPQNADCSQDSDFAVIPGAMQIQPGMPDNVTLDGLADVTSQQNVNDISGLDPMDTNQTPLDLGGFLDGHGEGAYYKSVILQQTVPGYTRSQTYNSTLTISVS